MRRPPTPTSQPTLPLGSTTSDGSTNPAAPSTDTTFPSHPDLTRLRTLGISNLSTTDRWRYHAYVYAFRRVVQTSRDQTSPLDAQGVWYSAQMADRAERWYRTERFHQPSRAEPAKYAAAAAARAELAHHDRSGSFRQLGRLAREIAPPKGFERAKLDPDRQAYLESLLK